MRVSPASQWMFFALLVAVLAFVAFVEYVCERLSYWWAGRSRAGHRQA
ncbi:MAG: hypothetical protein Q7S96_02555 [bacterium]|nr:hypothetical protein [bacterium]